MLDMSGIRNAILVFRMNSDLLVLFDVVLYFRPNGCICSLMGLPSRTRMPRRFCFDPKDLEYGVFNHCAFLPWNSS